MGIGSFCRYGGVVRIIFEVFGPICQRESCRGMLASVALPETLSMALCPGTMLSTRRWGLDPSADYCKAVCMWGHFLAHSVLLPHSVW